MTYRWLRDLDVAARKSGLKVVTIPGWQNRGRPASAGHFDPKGVMAHHTGDNVTGLRVANGVLKNGRAGLPGPLSQIGLDKDGTVYVIAAGRANHAGRSKRVGFMRAGDGNAQAIGIEAFNSGSSGWSLRQIDAYYRLSAALCDHYGWSRNNVVGHGEASTTGKWDPGARSGKMLDMDHFRRKVREVQLSGKPKPKVWLSDWDPSDFGPGKAGPQITLLDRRLIAHGFPGTETNPTVWSADMQRRVAAFQRSQGWSGPDADGRPGNESLTRLTLSPAKPRPTPRPPTPPVPGTVADVWLVVPGDTAWKIAQYAGITVEQLVEWNDLVDPSLLTPGMMLKVKPPVSGNPPVPPPAEEPDTSEDPVPKPGGKVRLRAATGNVNVHWKGNWGARSDDVARVVKRGRASVVGMCEMSTAAAGARFVQDLGWGNEKTQVEKHNAPKSRESWDVHGGPHPGVRIFAGWDPDKRRCLEVREFTTVGNRNSRAIAVLLQDRETGVLSVWTWSHLEFEPKGKNPRKHWGNERRFDQADSWFRQANKFAADAEREYNVDFVPVFAGGDMNGDLDDPYDGPGQAAKKHGLVDSDLIAEKKVAMGSTHAKPGGLKPGGRIDRWFVSKRGVRVLATETLEAYPETDHNVVVIHVEFSNDR